MSQLEQYDFPMIVRQSRLIPRKHPANKESVLRFREQVGTTVMSLISSISYGDNRVTTVFEDY